MENECSYSTPDGVATKLPEVSRTNDSRRFKKWLGRQSIDRRSQLPTNLQLDFSELIVSILWMSFVSANDEYVQASYFRFKQGIPFLFLLLTFLRNNTAPEVVCSIFDIELDSSTYLQFHLFNSPMYFLFVLWGGAWVVLYPTAPTK